MMGNYHVRFGGRERRVLIEARPSRPNAEMGSAMLAAFLESDRAFARMRKTAEA